VLYLDLIDNGKDSNNGMSQHNVQVVGITLDGCLKVHLLGHWVVQNRLTTMVPKLQPRRAQGFRGFVESERQTVGEKT
jgi:hypothetical protein